jgi:hypothetical protein
VISVVQWNQGRSSQQQSGAKQNMHKFKKGTIETSKVVLSVRVLSVASDSSFASLGSDGSVTSQVDDLKEDDSKM